MNPKLSAALLISVLLSSAAQAAGSAENGMAAIKGLNVIVLGDFTLNAGEVEGKTFVLGNLNGSNAQYGFGNSNQGTSVSDYATLVVGGNVTQQSIKIFNGSNGGSGTISKIPTLRIGGSAREIDVQAKGATVTVGGNLTKLDAQSGATIVVGGNAANVALNSPSQLDVHGNLQNVNANSGSAIRVDGQVTGNTNYNGATHVEGAGSAIGVPVSSATIAAEGAGLKDDLTALASALGNLTVTANPSTTSFDGNNFIFNAIAGSGGFAAFDIDASSSNFLSATSIGFTGSQAIPIIVNIRGLPTLTINANMNNSAYNSSIIWNFLDTTTLTLNRQFNGTILAPDAVVNGNAVIEGTVVARILNQSGEVHLGTYARDTILVSDGAIVPEPATWLQMLIGFGLAGALLRRRRETTAT